jgi:lysophospholipase L1-like esterase
VRLLRLACAVSAAALVAATAAEPAAAQASGAPASVEIRAGDRLAFVGDSFFEREYPRGLIETALTLAHPDKALTFRNLGWSGDTVRGESRAYFGNAADGYGELLKSVDLAKPTLIFVSYGANESFDGSAGLDPFLTGYGKLLDDLATRTRRIVLLTPLPADRATTPLPPAALDERNRTLAQYSGAIRKLGASRQLAVIDLYTVMLAALAKPTPEPLFEQGMHLTDAGYAVAASQIASSSLASSGLRAGPGATAGPAGGSAAARPDPRDPRLAALRSLIVQKNASFFHRWRPANVTYLYLFRQREQGNNAVEIPRFDPLIAEKEREIAAMTKTLAAEPAGGAR